MNEAISQVREKSYPANGLTSVAANYLKFFYHNCELVVCNLNKWHRSAVFSVQPNVIVALCYLMGWISGVALLFIKREDSLLRFHAWQSILTFGILTVPIVVLNIVVVNNAILFLFLFVLYWIVIAFTVFLWLFLMLKAYRWQAYELGVFKNIVSKLSGTETENLLTYKKVEELAFKSSESVNLTAAIAETPRLGEKVRQDVNSLRGVLNEAVRSIVILCETRDPYTSSHQQQVSRLACAIAREMGLSDDQIEGIRIVGIVHDIGKVAVPAEILSKPGKLNSYEFGIIQTHPQVAYDILKGLVFPWPVAQATLQHHERLDGSGYPNGLSGKDIIIEARILGVADVVEAMASHRPYRPALGIAKALDEIAKNKGKLYDAKVAEACLKLFAENHFSLIE